MYVLPPDPPEKPFSAMKFVLLGSYARTLQLYGKLSCMLRNCFSHIDVISEKLRCFRGVGGSWRGCAQTCISTSISISTEMLWGAQFRVIMFFMYLSIYIYMEWATVRITSH